MNNDLLRDTLALVLAGGRGERLNPLTQDRTKGAVPFGGPTGSSTSPWPTACTPVCAVSACCPSTSLPPWSAICARTGTSSALSWARAWPSSLSPGVVVDHQAEVVDSVLMEGVRVGPGAMVCRAILDKGVEVPAGCAIGVDLEEDRQRFHVSPGGVVVLPKGTDLSRQAEEAQCAHAFYGNGSSLRRS